MMTQTSPAFKYLNITQFSEIGSWSAYALMGKRLAYTQKYDFVKIGSFLKKSHQTVTIEDDNVYRRVTVKIHNKGVQLRDIVKGSEIGTKKQFIAKAGQFIISKIDARNGAFGVIPDDLEGAIVTNDFPLFEINTLKILPSFLVLIATNKAFSAFAQSASSGTTNRQRIDINQFLHQKIPLPSLTEQEAIINAYHSKTQAAESLLLQANELESEIERYLLGELGVEMEGKKEKTQKFALTYFTNLERWDTLFLLGRAPTFRSKYEAIRLSQLITHFNQGIDGHSIRIDSAKHPNKNFKYIGMEHIEKETGNLLELVDVKGAEVKSQTLQVPSQYIIYGKLRPYLNKYWINDTKHENIICSSEFFVFDIVKTLNKLFFKYVLSSKIIQHQISDKTSGARMPRINESIFFNLSIPLPPLPIQDKIVAHINALKDQIKTKRAEAARLQSQAAAEFEAAIFQS